jgi:hypothetical protein
MHITLAVAGDAMEDPDSMLLSILSPLRPSAGEGGGGGGTLAPAVTTQCRTVAQAARGAPTPQLVSRAVASLPLSFQLLSVSLIPPSILHAAVLHRAVQAMCNCAVVWPSTIRPALPLPATLPTQKRIEVRSPLQFCRPPFGMHAYAGRQKGEE